MIATHGECHNRACFNPRHLSWASPVQNAVDRRRDDTQIEGVETWNAKLDDSKVREIRQLKSEGLTLRSISEMFGVSMSAVSHVVTRRSWKHVT